MMIFVFLGKMSSVYKATVIHYDQCRSVESTSLERTPVHTPCPSIEGSPLEWTQTLAVSSMNESSVPSQQRTPVLYNNYRLSLLDN